MTQITETAESYEMYEHRRRQEVQDELVAKGESNKIANKARQNARFGRFGINQKLPRSQEELAIVAEAEKRVLGVTVEPATNIIIETPKNDAVAALIDEQCSSIDVEKQPENDENSVVIGQKTSVPEIVDSRHFCDLGKPFFDDGTQPEVEVPPIEQLLHTHYDLLDTSIQSGTHLSVAEVLNRCGLPVNKANSNVVAALLKNTGHNYCKSKGQRGYWVTVRS